MYVMPIYYYHKSITHEIRIITKTVVAFGTIISAYHNLDLSYIICSCLWKVQSRMISLMTKVGNEKIKSNANLSAVWYQLLLSLFYYKEHIIGAVWIIIVTKLFLHSKINKIKIIYKTKREIGIKSKRKSSLWIPKNTIANLQEPVEC